MCQGRLFDLTWSADIKTTNAEGELHSFNFVTLKNTRAMSEG